MLYVGINDDQIVCPHREFLSLRYKKSSSAHHIKQLAEGMGVKNALPVPFIF